MRFNKAMLRFLFALTLLSSAVGCKSTEAVIPCDGGCDVGRGCVDDACRVLCNHTTECAVGDVCDDGYCQVDEGGGECSGPSDCDTPPDACFESAGTCQSGGTCSYEPIDLDCSTVPSSGCNAANDAWVVSALPASCVDGACDFTVSDSVSCPDCDEECQGCVNVSGCDAPESTCLQARCDPALNLCEYDPTNQGGACTSTNGTAGSCDAGVCKDCTNDIDCEDPSGLPECLETSTCNEGVCDYAYDADRSCGTASCEEGALTGVSTCGTDGACAPADGQADCGGFSCANATTCRDTCSGAVDCVQGFTCTIPTCEVDVAAASVLHSTLEVLDDTLTADNVDFVNVLITLRNGNGDPIVGEDVEIAVTGSGNLIAQPSSATTSNGEAIAAVKTTQAETKTVSISLPLGLESITDDFEAVPGR